MGKQEDIVLQFLSKNDRIADLFNGACLEGEQVIRAEDLSPWTESLRTVVHDKDGNTIIHRERDIARVLRLNGTEILLLICCIEHQEHINYCMPYRILMYDCLEYADQVNVIQRQHKDKRDLIGDEHLGLFGKEDKLLPTITLILYTGEKEWDAGKCLWDILGMDNIDKRLYPLIGDWPLNLIQFDKIKDWNKYHSDIRLVLEIMNYRNNPDDLREFVDSHEEYHDLSMDTYMMISKFMNIDELMNMEPENLLNEQGGINMCKAVKGIYEEGKIEGKIEGIHLTKRVMKLSMEGKTEEEIAKEENISLDIVHDILAE